MKKRLLQTLITCTVVSSLIVTPVLATPQDEVKELEQKKKAAEAEAASVNNELVNLLLDYDALQADIKNQEKKIDKAEKDLQIAEEKEKQQYEDMKLRIKYMYEQGDATVVETLVSSKSFSELVNKAEYVQNVHDYDRDMLNEYVETQKQVKAKKLELESDKADMEFMADEMKVQKANLESTLTTMRKQIADFDEELEDAKAEAKAYLEELQRQQEEEERRQQEAAQQQQQQGSQNNQSGSNDSNSGGSSSGSESSGSASSSNASLGQKIANKGCEYVGNKYVYGGNSLTNGIDCSGFVQQIHAKFGIYTPRTSSALRFGGKYVSRSEMLPGDVVCYSGHVAIYIGGGKIVHASNSRPYPAGGIKISDNYAYRTVLAIRRYW